MGRKSRVKLLLLDFLGFCFAQLAQALLNSTPQLLTRDRCAVAQGAQFGPGDLRMAAILRRAAGRTSVTYWLQLRSQKGHR
jgi:hypothetical protein